jgi:hypothetical protein
MSINIYVGNLSFDASEGELKGLFGLEALGSSKCKTGKKVLKRSRNWIRRSLAAAP